MYGKFPLSQPKIGDDFYGEKKRGHYVITVKLKHIRRKNAIEEGYFARVYCSPESKNPEQNFNVHFMPGEELGFVFNIEEERLFPDDKVHVQFFSVIDYEKDKVNIPAGHAMIDLDVLKSEMVAKGEVEIINVSASDLNPDSVDRELGSVRWAMKTNRLIDTMAEDRTLDLFDYTREKRNNKLIEALYDSRNGTLRGYVGKSVNLKPFTNELLGIRMLFQYTPLGLVPAQHYFELVGQAQAQSAALEYMIERALNRSNISKETFVSHAKEMPTQKEFTPTCMEIIEISVCAITMMPLLMHYIPDLAIRKQTLATVEFFNSLVILRRAGDCEDKAFIAAWVFHSVVFADFNGSDLFEAWRSILKHYVPSWTLLSVAGAQLSDAVEVTGDKVPDVMNRLPPSIEGAHMTLTLINRDYFARSLGVDRLPHGVVVEKDGYVPGSSNEEVFKTVAAEGTGNMAAFVDTYESYFGNEGRMILWDNVVKSAKALSPQTYEEDSDDITISPDPRMKGWKTRALVEFSGVPPSTAMTTRFYRIIRAMGVAAPGVGNYSRFEIEYEGKYGIPYLALARHTPAKFVLSDPYHPQVQKIIDRIMRHVCVDERISLPRDSQHVNFMAHVQYLFQKAVTTGLGGRKKKTDIIETYIKSVVTEPTATELYGLQKFIESNPYLSFVEVFTEVFDNVGNIGLKFFLR